MGDNSNSTLSFRITYNDNCSILVRYNLELDKNNLFNASIHHSISMREVKQIINNFIDANFHENKKI